mmetsp:Transcript_50557/g.156454  ORF Transcript_50557/g.156454 Transcript_50557/m.156454 type:complete len:202 (-) Transcript_50557:666-1271(-)
MRARARVRAHVRDARTVRPPHGPAAGGSRASRQPLSKRTWQTQRRSMGSSQGRLPTTCGSPSLSLWIISEADLPMGKFSVSEPRLKWATSVPGWHLQTMPLHTAIRLVIWTMPGGGRGPAVVLPASNPSAPLLWSVRSCNILASKCLRKSATLMFEASSPADLMSFSLSSPAAGRGWEPRAGAYRSGTLCFAAAERRKPSA